MRFSSPAAPISTRCEKNGLTVESVNGDLHLPKVNATDDPKTVGPVDIVLFAVKLWDTEKAAEAARPLVGPATRVITLQNGIDSVERIAPILGAEQTVGGAAYISATIAAPGVIRNPSHFAGIRFGRADGKADATLQAFVDAAKAAKVDAGIAADIQRELWQKFIFLAAMSAATASLRSSIGPIVADPELRDYFRKLMEEVLAIGKAKGVNLDPAIIDERMNFVLTKIEPGDEGLDGLRSRARQPARARLALRQGARARPRAQHSDAGARHRLYRAQARPQRRQVMGAK